MKVHDLIGIGFGPSNIALAIALEEQRQNGRHLDALFIEKQPHFAWHKDMLLEHTDMQISFLKDLATLRNPRSRFTFINYLFEKGRLQDFINLKTFFPSRQEFNDYLSWAAGQFHEQCAYNEETVEVLPEIQGEEITLLRIRTRDDTGRQHERLTRNLVVSIGGSPNIPECFRPAKDDPRVFHSSRFLSSMARLDNAHSIAVIGAGQSAAEIFLDLYGRPQAPKVDLIMRGHSMHPSDDSPSVNEIFNTEFTDYMYSRSHAERADLLAEFRHTNYAAPDIDQIEQIFKILYEQKVANRDHHHLLRRHETQRVRIAEDGVHLQLLDLDSRQTLTRRYDAIVLATGYNRTRHTRLLEPLTPYLGDFSVDRRYRLQSTPDFQPAVFLQGTCEATHGLSDTLLSITAIRTHEISEALFQLSNSEPNIQFKKSVTA